MLPWQPLRIEVVVGYTFDLMSEAIFYLLRTFLTVAMVTLLYCYHGNRTKGKICAKFVQSLMLIHITIVKKYTIISITWGYYLLPWQPLR